MSGCGEIAGAGPGVHSLGGELSDPLGHADGIEVAGDDLAPAWPNASATAFPICPARPTPVTNTTLPRKSNAVRHAHLRALEHDLRAGRAGLGVEERAILRSIRQTDRAMAGRRASALR